MNVERQIPVERDANGAIRCDVCGRPATVERRATKSREQAFYCDDDADRYVGWPEKAYPIQADDAA